jgi:hypothetical protein
MTKDNAPSRFHASPAEIDAFLRQHFAEDVLLNFYRAVGDEVLDEALMYGKQRRAVYESRHCKHLYLAGMSDVIDQIWDYRYYPANLPKLGTYDRPFNPPRTTVAQEEFQAALEASSLGAPHVKEARRQVPQEVRKRLADEVRQQTEPEYPCYRTKAHEPHQWLKGRRAVPCPGTPQEGR